MATASHDEKKIAVKSTAGTDATADVNVPGNANVDTAHLSEDEEVEDAPDMLRVLINSEKPLIVLRDIHFSTLSGRRAPRCADFRRMELWINS